MPKAAAPSYLSQNSPRVLELGHEPSALLLHAARFTDAITERSPYTSHVDVHTGANKSKKASKLIAPGVRVARFHMSRCRGCLVLQHHCWTVDVVAWRENSTRPVLEMRLLLLCLPCMLAVRVRESDIALLTHGALLAAGRPALDTFASFQSGGVYTQKLSTTKPPT